MLFQKGKTDAARFEMIPLERIQMTEWNVRIGEQLSIVFSCFDKSIFNVLQENFKGKF